MLVQNGSECKPITATGRRLQEPTIAMAIVGGFMNRIAILVLVLLVVFLASAQELYFPKGSLSAHPRSDSFKAEWYSTYLKALNEPSLLQLARKSDSESYRFVWLRTFHHSVVVRLDVRKDEIGELTVKVSDGAGGYKPGQIIENLSRPLTREETKMFLAKIQKLNFWTLPTQQEIPGNDGAQWIIEGVKDGRYHVVDWWTPREGPVRELGVTLALGLAGLKVPKDEVY
jgi:hypothetical protein